MIEEQSHAYPIRELCAALKVSRSGYYAWRAGQESARELANGVMAQEIKQLFEAKRQRYGSPRITEQLRRQGQVCNHKRVERLMRQEGLKARSGRKRKVRTTNSLGEPGGEGGFAGLGPRYGQTGLPARSHPSLRSRYSVCVCGVSSRTPTPRSGGQHEPQGQLL